MPHRSLILALLLLAPPAVAQPADPAPPLTGELRLDLRAAEAAAAHEDRFFGREGPRNPALAAGLSVAVPGLGQAYNGSWVRAAAMLGLEVGLWAGYATWRGQGLDGRDAYQAFAHREWSPLRYAAWLNDYPGYAGPPLDLSALDGIDFTNPDAWSAAERATVLDFFDALRAAERAARYVNADGTGSGAGFSHVLDDFGEQQYYELIGKYFQYGPGWSDWCAGRPAGDPSCYSLEGQEQQAQFADKTGQFFAYAEDHADANTLLRRASRVTSCVLANHVLSALDAALTARFHNRRLQLGAGLELRPAPDGSAMPVGTARLRF